MFRYIAAAIILVIIVYFIYQLCDTDDRRRRRCANYMIQSAGGFDEPARAAIREIDRIAAPTADDYFRRGYLMQHNVLGTAAPVPTVRRVAAIGGVLHDYTRALLTLNTADQVDPGFIVRRAEIFNDDIARMDDDDTIVHLIMQFGDLVATTATRTRQDIATDRINRVSATTTSHAQAISAAIDDASTFTSDGQNVHDTNVNADLRETIQKIKASIATPVDPTKCIHDASVLALAAGSTKAQNASRVLAIIRKGYFIETFNDTEDMIFAYVWTRCDHPRNHAAADLMREAIITALADSIENGTEVCINGRCARVINSLATLDYDDTMSGALTFEAYRNQAFQDVKDAVAVSIDRARESSDPATRAAGDAYDLGNEPPDTAADQAFRSDLKNAIDVCIDAYTAKLSSAERANLKSECYIYATL